MAIDPGRLFIEGIIISLKTAPLLWFFILAIALTSLLISIYKIIRLAKSNMFEIDKMTGEEFESYLEILFKNDGYNVNHVGGSDKYHGDWGADLIIEKNGYKTAVQAKRWKWMVTEKAVQEVTASKAQYGCQGAMVVTNSRFSYHARHLARMNHVLLWDRNILASEILRVKKQNREKIV